MKGIEKKLKDRRVSDEYKILKASGSERDMLSSDSIGERADKTGRALQKHI